MKQRLSPWRAARTCIICVTVSMHMKTSASVRPRTLRASLMYWSSLSTWRNHMCVVVGRSHSETGKEPDVSTDRPNSTRQAGITL